MGKWDAKIAQRQDHNLQYQEAEAVVSELKRETDNSPLEVFTDKNGGEMVLEDGMVLHARTGRWVLKDYTFETLRLIASCINTVADEREPVELVEREEARVAAEAKAEAELAAKAEADAVG